MAAGNHAVTHGPQQNVKHRHKSAGMKCNGYKVISSLKALPHMVQGGFLSDLRRFRAIPHNSKCRYGERGAAAARPKTQIILDAAKVSAASGGNSEPKQGQRSQSARGFCPRSTMRVSQPDIIEHFGNADAVPQLPERCLSRKAGIVRCCLNPPPVKNPIFAHFTLYKIHTNIKAATPAAWHDTAGVAVIYGR